MCGWQVLREPRLYLDQRLELKSLMASLTGTNDKGGARCPALHVSVSATPPGTAALPSASLSTSLLCVDVVPLGQTFNMKKKSKRFQSLET